MWHEVLCVGSEGGRWGEWEGGREEVGGDEWEEKAEKGGESIREEETRDSHVATSSFACGHS